MTEKPDLDLAPCCFGLAVAHSRKSQTCLACPYEPQCGERAGTMLAKLRANMANVNVAIASVASSAEEAGKAIASAGESFLEASATASASSETRAPRASNELPKKSQELLERLARNGLDIAAIVASGKVPEPPTRLPSHMKVACELMMAGKPFTRADFKQAFQKLSRCSDGTASSHASLTIPVLVALDLIEENDGVISMK